MKYLFFLATFVISLTTLGISRVGNGVINRAAGYSTQPPDFLNVTDVIGQNSIRFRGLNLPGLNLFSGFNPIFVEIHPIENKFPELASLDRSAFGQGMKIRGYKKHPHLNPCVEVWIKSNDSAYTGFVKWGTNSGYLIAGENSDQVLDALNKIIENTKLLDGACSWKN